MRPPIECQGAPRDLGFDCGAACRPALVAHYRRSPLRERLLWRAGWSDARGGRLARDLARYFPRQAEALEGMARGAGVPRAWLVARLARACEAPDATCEADACAVAASGALSDGGGLLARGLPAEWVLRRARPGGGIHCLELAPPWFPGALAALSETGVAAAVVPLAAGAEVGRCTAPAALLVQDALHRTESLAGALEWCLSRPAGGRATILLADARGEVAEVAIAGDARRVLRPADGLVVEAAGRSESEIAKALHGASALDAVQLAEALPAGGVALDPAARRLGVAGPVSGVEPPHRVAWIDL